MRAASSGTARKPDPGRSIRRIPIRTPDPAGLYPPPRWEQRFRAGRVFLPEWASLAPERAVLIASSGGALQVHSFESDTGRLVRATDRPGGTTRATIDPTGQWIWWFDDTDGNEFGTWRRQPFGSTPPRYSFGSTLHRHESALDLAPAYDDAGLVLGADGTAIVGRSDPRYGTQIHQVLVGAAGYGATAPVPLYAHPQDARVAALSRDGNLVAISHSERGDALHPAIRVVRGDTGTVVADLDDGAGLGLWAQSFAPVAGDNRLLVRHERTGSPALLIWDVANSLQRPVDLSLPGDVAGASWAPDGRSLLVSVDHRARTLLFRYRLSDGRTHAVGPRSGTVTAATPRPDEDAWAHWSSAAEPPSVTATSTGAELLHVGTRAPSSVPVTDVWAEGPGGAVHALLRRPPGVSEPHPVVVRLHGGPHAHDTDAFDAEAAAWVDHGLAVLNVNFRGSTGYGNTWREGLGADAGFAELADVAAVHQTLIDDGVLDPGRSVLSGKGWGGYLTLLGLGTQPERWAAAVAVAPVADTVEAYRSESAARQAWDRSMFGGTPEQVPQAYRKASPITYVDQVRAPVLIVASRNDTRGPIGQIEGYVQALRTAGGHVSTSVDNLGHGTHVDTDRIAQMRAQLVFVHEHVAPTG
ncbi:prolyl oligopeptidase family serine peptidase [Sanguibacter sp. Z1732]|uniref:S9 family peptidase n=1 Tax=Sanguibacter sp. Z1732 TaxID=3435412 RepID=UPI003D9C7FE9